MASSENLYRKMLVDVADQLTDDDAKMLAYRVPFSPRERSKIKTGLDFVYFYEKSERVSIKDITQLLDLLVERELPTAAEIVERYQNKFKKGEAVLCNVNKHRAFEWTITGRTSSISMCVVSTYVRLYSHQWV